MNDETEERMAVDGDDDNDLNRLNHSSDSAQAASPAYEMLRETRVLAEEIVSQIVAVKKQGIPKSHLKELVTKMFLNFVSLRQRKELCKLHYALEQRKKSILDAIADRKKFLSSLPSLLKSLKKASLPVQNQLGLPPTKKLKAVVMQSAKLATGDVRMFDERKCLRPYKWAQHSAGIDFLPEVSPFLAINDNPSGEITRSENVTNSISMYRLLNHVPTILERVRSRMKAQLAFL